MPTASTGGPQRAERDAERVLVDVIGRLLLFVVRPDTVMGGLERGAHRAGIAAAAAVDLGGGERAASPASGPAGRISPV